MKMDPVSKWALVSIGTIGVVLGIAVIAMAGHDYPLTAVGATSTPVVSAREHVLGAQKAADVPQVSPVAFPAFLAKPKATARPNQQVGVEQNIPTLCGTSNAGTANAPHSVCGIVASIQPLGPNGTGAAVVSIPTSMAFPDDLYSILVTPNGDVVEPPSKCIFTGQRISPTQFLVRWTGCTVIPLDFAYQVTTTTELPVR